MANRENSVVTVDNNGRFSIGTRLKGTKFRLREQKDGNILLERIEIVPASEGWFFKDKARVAAMDKSMDQSSRGEVEEISVEELIDL